MSATAYGWALLAITPVMLIMIVWPMLDDGAAAADIHRIEAGIGVSEPERERCPDPCRGRRCAVHSGVYGTVAQRRHSRAAEQHAIVRAITEPTQELAIVGAAPRERFADANPYAVRREFWERRPNVTALTAMWADAEFDIPRVSEIGRPPVELVHIGRRAVTA